MLPKGKKPRASAAERRRAQRRRRRLRVSLEPGSVTSVTGDLSSGGIFVHSARILHPGTEVRVVVQLPQGLARAEGVVRWAKRVPTQLLGHVRGGIGIEFTWVSAELAAFLSDGDGRIQEAV
jgi:hypothetical protein